MFESDDFDQVLSQFELPEDQDIKCTRTEVTKSVEESFFLEPSPVIQAPKATLRNVQELNAKDLKFPDSSKHIKRKLINSHFDHKSKRKFPGPAGILSGCLEETKDNSECQIELLSQDIDYAQCHLQKHLFESPLWTRLLDDLKTWKLQDVNCIKTIKQQALDGNLRKMKAQTVAAFVEMVDRSAIDPLVTLRDSSGTIKCTLHRDAWSSLSQYIVSEYCAIVLCKPTVLTTGSTLKKHYLNITLSNIVAVYSSTVIDENEECKVPSGYTTIQEDGYTIVKSERSPDSHMCNQKSNNFEVLDDLDNIFSDEIF